VVALLLAFVWTFAASSVAAWAAFGARAFARAARRESPYVGALPSVCIVRPCAGHDPWLLECLSSLPRPGACARRVVFAVESPGDDAAPAVLLAEDALSLRGVDARVVWTAARGPNHKADQIARALAQKPPPCSGAHDDVIVIADADVDLTDVDLDALVGPFAENPRLAATWAPPVEITPPRTLGDRASQAVLGASLHAFPLLAALDPAGMVGKLCAVRASALAEAGGFEALRVSLGEDMELARRLRELGYLVCRAHVLARSRASGRTFSEAVSRYARWLTVIRAQRPALLASYPLLFAFVPGALLLVALGARDAPFLAACTALFAMASRVSTAYVAARATARPTSMPHAALESLFSDVVLLAAFARAVSVRSVRWRGHSLRTDRAGRLAEVER
jgi:ceramide glucosyltransferase